MGKMLKMGVKFLAQIKKIQEKAILCARNPHEWTPAIKTSDVFSAGRQSPLKVLKNVLASRLGVVGGKP